jgi:hypothetical protein
MSIETIRLLKAQALIPKQKKIYHIKKVSDKRANQIKQQKQNNSDEGMDKFFNAMRKKCKGKCLFCNSGTTYKNDELWRIAIAHLLPKSKFKSIATNEQNWIELCWNCHTDFDSSKITWELLKDSKEWDIIKEKLFDVLPLVSGEERKYKLYSKLINLLYN